MCLSQYSLFWQRDYNSAVICFTWWRTFLWQWLSHLPSTFLQHSTAARGSSTYQLPVARLMSNLQSKRMCVRVCAYHDFNFFFLQLASSSSSSAYFLGCSSTPTLSPCALRHSSCSGVSMTASFRVHEVVELCVFWWKLNLAFEKYLPVGSFSNCIITYKSSLTYLETRLLTYFSWMSILIPK